MKYSVVLVLCVLAACLACNQNRVSYKDAVQSALKQADLTDVSVSEDTSKSTLTLTGTLHLDADKSKAGEIAQTNAPGDTVANEISVQVVGSESESKNIASNLDDGIESNFKAALISTRLDKQDISYKAKNGVLTLTGSVKHADQKAQAQTIASKIPNVQQVVNQIEVK
jgi:hyperosmotically inducible protein